MNVAVQEAYGAANRLTANDYVEQNYELVTRIAYHLAARLPASVEVDDLIQAGLIGLLEASQNYDDSHDAGASFSTFASLRIRGAMLDEVRRNGWAPRSVQKHTRDLAEATRKTEQRLGRTAEPAEIAEELGISIDNYYEMAEQAARSNVLAFDDVANDEGDISGISAADQTPEQSLLVEDFQGELANAIDNLPERERMVMALYYQEELNLKEIGAVLGVSESRVCQLHGQALTRLRARLGDWVTDLPNSH
ncbi:MAG: RNA polymerase sigma factor FliA [Nevskiales bacterium]